MQSCCVVRGESSGHRVFMLFHLASVFIFPTELEGCAEPAFLHNMTNDHGAQEKQVCGRVSELDGSSH